ncbi:energy-coupling factor transporter transmembrane protein EcfT [Dehalobacter sp. TBBPA1]|uniref:energy-coupling factor transporter transmembrane component T family protein n=1 Tax=Dehalobacter sp. TBBPA1 TaxID=3235037 RepID=UPI0034A5784F
MMPEWLLRGEPYTPQTDKDTFINKSILSLFEVISRIRTQNEAQADRLYVNAVLKVVFALLLVVLLSLSRNLTFVVVVGVYLLVILSLMRGEEIIRILKISLAMALFSFILLLPAVFWGNTYSAVMITSKVFATVTAVNILSHSSRWSSLTSAIKVFHVPDIFIFVLDITIKYIVMLGELSLSMLYALKLRSVGKNKSKYTSLSGIAGTMFIKSKEMAEEMYSAMECRGFTGEYRVYHQWKFSWADGIFILINAGIIFAFLYLK